MEKIDRQLLIKEISTRLPYGVKAKVDAWDEEKGEIEVSLKIYSINTDGYVYFEPNDYDIDYLYVDNCLLYLRPMTSMTEEEKKELKDICTIYNSDPSSSYEYFGIEIFHISRYGTYFESDYTAIDWLNARHFDYYRLIEKGLALEAPEGMYRSKKSTERRIR